jgi:hypothetical protein
MCHVSNRIGVLITSKEISALELHVTLSELLFEEGSNVFSLIIFSWILALNRVIEFYPSIHPSVHLVVYLPVYLSIYYLSICGSTVLLLDLRHFFSFLILYRVGRTLGRGISP